MPLTVITLKNSPLSLRGDLSKWMQEIATGVYVGNFNTKVREELWKRVVESVGIGEATMSYAFRNEIGYQFITHNTMKTSVDFDGSPLVLSILKEEKSKGIKKGFSNASKFMKAKKFSSIKQNSIRNYVVIDVETNGLDYENNQIIEIGAVKIYNGNTYVYNQLIRAGSKLPKDIVNLTGITDKLLNEKGVSIELGLEEFLEFIGDIPIIGYNVEFDIKFINKELLKLNKPKLNNNSYDIMKYVKRDKMFLPNYKLQTVLIEYGISEDLRHRALEDAKMTNELATKVNGFLEKIK